jgi:hypothetical protein
VPERRRTGFAAPGPSRADPYWPMSAGRFPDSAYRGLRQSGLGRHRCPRPVRGVVGLALQGRRDHLLDRLVRDRPRGTRTRFISQPVKARLHEPSPPHPHRLGPHTDLGSDFLVGFACCATQHDPTPLRQRLRRLRSPRPPLQCLTLVVGQHGDFGCLRLDDGFGRGRALPQDCAHARGHDPSDAHLHAPRDQCHRDTDRAEAVPAAEQLRKEDPGGERENGSVDHHTGDPGEREVRPAPATVPDQENRCERLEDPDRYQGQPRTTTLGSHRSDRWRR